MGSIEPFLDEVVHKEFLFSMNETIVNGTGVGKALGTVQAPATITVPKDINQATKTLTTSNVSNMYIRMHGPSRCKRMLVHQRRDRR